MDLLVLGFFFLFLILGVPLYLFLFALSSYLFLQAGIPILSTVVSFQKLQSQEFVSAIPLFTFAGYLLSRSQSPIRIVNLTKACFSFIPASSSMIVIILMTLFTALTGASGVSILAIGGLMFPLLKKVGEEKFAHGLITSSGSIGLLFAPSLPVIIYAIVVNQNSSSYYQVEIDTLFRIAIIPSLLLISFFVTYSYFKEKKTKLYFRPTEAWQAIKGAGWEIPLPILIYGGIYSGWFTVLEAGVVTACYTFLVVFLINRDLGFKKDFASNTVDSLKLSGNIFIIMATAFILTNYIVYQEIPDRLFGIISPYLQNKFTFLLAINLILLLTGCLLDIFSAILIVLPIIIPLVEKYGIDPYHFAIIFLINLEIGYITPPVGLNLFISSYRFKKSISHLYRSTIPFLFLMLTALVILTYIPSLTTFLNPTKNSVKQTNLPQIKSLQVLSKTAGSITLAFKLTRPPSSQSTIKYRIYFLDELEDNLSTLLDFSESKDYLHSELESKNEQLLLTLDGLTSDTYSIVIVPVDDPDHVGIPSNIVTATIP